MLQLLSKVDPVYIQVSWGWNVVVYVSQKLLRSVPP